MNAMKAYGDVEVNLHSFPPQSLNACYHLSRRKGRLQTQYGRSLKIKILQLSGIEQRILDHQSRSLVNTVTTLSDGMILKSKMPDLMQ